MDNETKKYFGTYIEKARAGDKNAFRVIFERLSNKLFAYVYSRTSSREDSLDIVQETFVDLWRSINKFEYRSDDEFSGYVFLIAKRRIYKFYKKRKYDAPADENSVSQSYEMEKEDYRYLLGSISTLASHYQDLIKLRYFSDLSYSEIASILDIKVATAKVWHHRAIKELQGKMAHYE